MSENEAVDEPEDADADDLEAPPEVLEAYESLEFQKALDEAVKS